MKIAKFKKMSKGRYKITLDKEGEFILYEEVIFKHELLLKKDISLEKLDKILEDNKFYEAYNLALSYIEYKLRSKKEIEDYLERKEFDRTLINDIIDELSKKGYINDTSYAKAFINDKISFTNHGPYKIRQALISNGVPEEIVDEELNKIDENIFREKITKMIQKRKKANNKPSNIFKSKVMEYLFSLGYSKDMILENLDDCSEEDDEFTLAKIMNEKEKLFKKYEKKYSGSSLEFQVKAALYRKGYNKETIERVMEQ